MNKQILVLLSLSMVAAYALGDEEGLPRSKSSSSLASPVALSVRRTSLPTTADELGAAQGQESLVQAAAVLSDLAPEAGSVQSGPLAQEDGDPNGSRDSIVLPLNDVPADQLGTAEGSVQQLPEAGQPSRDPAVTTIEAQRQATQRKQEIERELQEVERVQSGLKGELYAMGNILVQALECVEEAAKLGTDLKGADRPIRSIGANLPNGFESTIADLLTHVGRHISFMELEGQEAERIRAISIRATLNRVSATPISAIIAGCELLIDSKREQLETLLKRIDASNAHFTEQREKESAAQRSVTEGDSAQVDLNQQRVDEPLPLQEHPQVKRLAFLQKLVVFAADEKVCLSLQEEMSLAELGSGGEWAKAFQHYLTTILDGVAALQISDEKIRAQVSSLRTVKLDLLLTGLAKYGKGNVAEMRGLIAEVKQVYQDFLSKNLAESAQGVELPEESQAASGQDNDSSQEEQVNVASASGSAEQQDQGIASSFQGAAEALSSKLSGVQLRLAQLQQGDRQEAPVVQPSGELDQTVQTEQPGLQQQAASPTSDDFVSSPGSESSASTLPQTVVGSGAGAAGMVPGDHRTIDADVLSDAVRAVFPIGAGIEDGVRAPLRPADFINSPQSSSVHLPEGTRYPKPTARRTSSRLLAYFKDAGVLGAISLSGYLLNRFLAHPVVLPAGPVRPGAQPVALQQGSRVAPALTIGAYILYLLHRTGRLAGVYKVLGELKEGQWRLF